MRILFLAHRIPYPPDKGDKIRSFHQLRGLVARGHEVHLCAFADDRDDLRHSETLATLCQSVHIVPLERRRAGARVLAGLLGAAPLSFRYFASAAMRRHVESTVARIRPHAVVVYSSPMAQYVPASLAARTAVDLVDVDSEKWEDYARSHSAPVSWLYATEARRLRRQEAAIVEQFGCSIVSTDREARLLPGVRPDGRQLYTITNGVDLDRYRPGALPDPRAALPASERRFLADRSVQRLVFTGTMDYHPNVDGVTHFVADIWPRIRAVEPSAEFLIVGRHPPAHVRRLATVPGVRVTGEVADVRPYLLVADAAVVPLRLARGIQNKVLEAMACACPVVATSEVAAGLGAGAEEHLLVATSPAELASAVVRVLRDAPLRRRLGAAGRGYVERQHQWAPNAARLADLLEAMAREAVPA